MLTATVFLLSLVFLCFFSLLFLFFSVMRRRCMQIFMMKIAQMQFFLIHEKGFIKKMHVLQANMLN